MFVGWYFIKKHNYSKSGVPILKIKDGQDREGSCQIHKEIIAGKWNFMNSEKSMNKACNYNVNRNNMWENSFRRIYGFYYAFEVERDTLCTKQTEIFYIFRYQTINFLKLWFLFWFLRRAKTDKNEFATKFVWNIAAIILIQICPPNS